MTHEDLFREITSMMEALLNYDEYELALLNTIPKDDQAKFIVRKENLIKQSAAGMMLGYLPEHLRQGYFKQWGHTAEFQTYEIVDIVVGSNVNNSQSVNHGSLANAENKNYKKQNRDKKPHFRKQKTKPKCLYCGKPHKLSECKILFQDNPDAEVFKTFGPPSIDEELSGAYEYTIQEKPETLIWNSGASTHMCCNKQFFIEYKDLKAHTSEISQYPTTSCREAREASIHAYKEPASRHHDQDHTQNPARGLKELDSVAIIKSGGSTTYSVQAVWRGC